MAGPCSVESREQLVRTADERRGVGRDPAARRRLQAAHLAVRVPGAGRRRARICSKKAAATPACRSSPRSWSPVRSTGSPRRADVLQIGARNMQNFPLLKEVGRTGKPTMLKRGLSATIEEWLMAAEYIMYAGNPNVILCERGIRTFETATRNTLDLSAIPLDQAHEPSAGHRRPEPRHGPSLPGRADGPGGRGGWRRRTDHRGPPRTRYRAVRRTAVADARRLRTA